MPTLSELRESLAILQSYELPERYEPFADAVSAAGGTGTGSSSSPSSSATTCTEPLLDPELIARYRTARREYVQRRTNELILEHLSTLQYQYQYEYDNGNDNGNDKDGMILNTNTNTHTHTNIHMDLPTIDPNDERDLQDRMIHIRTQLCDRAMQVKQSCENVYEKYKLLHHKRDQLAILLEQMEHGNGNGNRNGTDDYEDDDVIMDGNYDDENDNDNDNDNDIDEELKALIAKRDMLGGKLRKIRMETEDVNAQIASNQEHLNGLMELQQSSATSTNTNTNTSTSSPNSPNSPHSPMICGSTSTSTSTSSSKGTSASPSTSPTTAATTTALTHSLTMKNVQEVQKQLEEYRHEAQELEDMSACYESLKSALEHISGIKILSVTHHNHHHHHDEKENKENRRDRNSNRNDEEHNNNLYMTVLLLGKHIVQFTLTSTSTSTKKTCSDHGGRTSSSPPVEQAEGETFRVTGAKLQTSSILTTGTGTGTSTSTSSDIGTISIPIPPLDDLVSLAQDLEPSQDLRFVLRETMARIRTLTARMEELATLRKQYLTKIMDKANSNSNSKSCTYTLGGGGGGGDANDQEVICSLEAQVSVVMRLTSDCPIIRGSAKIHRIVGVGGWDDRVLQKIKNKVNERKLRSPVDVMDMVVEEIGRLEREDGVILPRTPVLPSRSRRK